MYDPDSTSVLDDADILTRLSREPKVAVQYIGHKPLKYDTIGNTRTKWNGHGDVQEVPTSVADRLLKHTTVWALPGTVDIEPPAPEPEPEFEPEPTVEDVINAMPDKAQLEAYVLENFGENIDKRKRLDVLKGDAIALYRKSLIEVEDDLPDDGEPEALDDGEPAAPESDDLLN